MKIVDKQIELDKKITIAEFIFRQIKLFIT